EHRLLLSNHHLLLDGWSRAIVLGEVLSFYEALREGRELDPPQPAPFRQYISWLERQDLGAAETFWRRTLAGFTAATPLGTGAAPSPGPGGGADQGGERIALSRPMTGALRAAARRHRLTLNTLLQGMWALLLSRYSGE